jgi:hypothetical protein
MAPNSNIDYTHNRFTQVGDVYYDPNVDNIFVIVVNRRKSSTLRGKLNWIGSSGSRS